jgi:tetratricopeptide (TPR) repeat protein
MGNRTKLDQWCDAILEAGWLAALVVAPLFFNVFSSRVFEPDKISLVRSIALTLIAVWLVKVANGGYAWLPLANSQPSEQPAGANWSGFVKNPLIGPVTLVIVAFALATVFSVAVFVSWFGSYQRMQGTYSFLAYAAIAALTAATMRRPEQLRRFQHAIILTSLPIAIYGIIQHYGLDPLPWGGDVQTRVAANAGNPIFLAAYLIMAFFLTLERVFTSFVRLLGLGRTAAGPLQDWQSSLAGGAYLFVLLVQTIALVWTQSRGPWLGWIPGIFLFILLAVSTVRPRYFRTLLSLALAGTLGLVLLVLAANFIPAFQFLQQTPYVGRFVNVFETESGTGKVRQLIWGGAAEMLLPHEPLTFPDGSQDGVNVLRPLIGYGPEAMWVAFNPFYPPELAHVEARNASPDRSHNEAWDSIVITGLLGFVGYIALFVTIFYWSLRWLGLITGRRDTLLYALLVTSFGIAGSLGLMAADGWQLRMAGLGLPFGIITGFGSYTALAAFLHAGVKPDRSDLPRLMIIIALLTAVVAHYLEIHFGIAIGATRTHFWILIAVLMLVGMRLLPVLQHTPTANAESDFPAAESPAPPARRSKAGTQPPSRRAAQTQAPPLGRLPRTVLTDVLIFLTFVYIYLTNAAGLTDSSRILSDSIFVDPKTGGTGPAIFFLMLFTWLVAAVLGLAEESLAQHRPPRIGWWLTGLGLHAAVVWGAWLVYGLIQAARLAPIPPPQGITNQDFLNLQLERVGGHFGFFTFVLITWMLAAGTFYVWPALRARGQPAAGKIWGAAATGVAASALAIFLIYTVNVNLVKADIVYKQGQQFDSQANWLSSVELYKRALATRATEDHYMLFLGRALLEQAKLSPVEGTATLPAALTLADVLGLTPDTVSQLGRNDLLRAAETVLLEAQRVNSLNTDHTANLARLYRTWADLDGAEPTARQQWLDRSVLLYDTAITLSPNAAHLWNERGNALLAAGKNEEALASFERSLRLDTLFDQTYLLLADYLERNGQIDRLKEVLGQGIQTFTERGNAPAAGQLLSYLGVVEARQGNLEGAAAANRQLLELLPDNLQALRNLAILLRDQNDLDQAMNFTRQAIAVATAPEDLAGLHQLAAELFQRQNNTEGMVAEMEKVRQFLPNDINTLRTLSSLYTATGNSAKMLEIAQDLMGLEPSNFQYALEAGIALLRLERRSEALALLQQAKTLAPPDQQPTIDALIAQANG